MPTIQVSPDADELLQSVANGILKSRKIIVVTGAGISTNSGIPDFRSENGLYALIQAQFDAANKDPTSPTALTRSNSSTSVGVFVDKPAKLERSWQHDLLRDGRDAAIIPSILGRDLFDVSIWSDPLRTSVFYTFATTLRQKARDVQPTASHLFISHLRDRGKLVRCYTQNIDQIEEKVGLSTSLQQGPGSRGRFSRKSAGGFSAPSSQGGEGEANESIVKRDAANGGVECVFLHGSLQSLRCFLCGRICEWDEGGRSVETLSGRQPECPHCVGATVAREERGKRALGVGKLRPDIVLYGEEHPNAHLIDPLVKHDLALYPDSLLILGTSLKVHGLKVLVREFAKTVHSKGGKVIFVNFTKPSESSWGDIIDYWVQWDCDAWVSNLQERVPLLWLPPGTKLPVPGKKKRESSGETKAAKRRSSGDVGKPVETGGSIIPDRIDSLISDTTGTRVLFENAPAGHGKNSSFAQNLVAVVSIMFCVALGYHPVPNASAH
ncbi:NAD-dependent histone deacetylase HST3 like protein [Verticillium longisporum]|nr:NAD-dependent histone deacetylase HST3 like protein [Verticillium longisporum]